MCNMKGESHMYESDHKVQYSMNQKKKERNLVLLTFLPIFPLLCRNSKREAFVELDLHLQQ